MRSTTFAILLSLSTAARVAAASPAPTDAAPWDGSSDEWQGEAIPLPATLDKGLNGVWARES